MAWISPVDLLDDDIDPNSSSIKIKTKGSVKLKTFAIAVASMVLIMSLSASVSASGKNVIQGGWYPWKPYQYLEKNSNDRLQLTGLDVQLLKEVFEEELGLTLKLPQVDWKVHQQDISEGMRDVAGGAFITPDRERYAYFSAPYRNEDIVLISRRSESSAIAMLRPDAFKQSFPSSKLRIGVVSGYYYGDAIDSFLKNPSNQDRWTSVKTDIENLQNLVNGKVDLVAIDRLVGSTLIWEESLSRDLIAGKEHIFSGPIVALFSRRTTSPALVAAFDQAMQKLKDDGRYNQIVRDYLFPSLLAMTAGQPWFFALETIGTAAFAFSGILLARRDRFSLFGALVLASLPAFGGGIIRDLIANRDQPAVLQSTHNLIIVIALVLISHFLARLTKLRGLPRMLEKLHFGEKTVQVLDALGLSAFTVVGVIVAVEEKCNPLILWGPIFSAMTGAGGAILRDVIRADASHPTLRHDFYAELSFFWGLMLSIFITLYASSNNLHPLPMNLAVLFTTLGCLLSRLIVMQRGIKSSTFMSKT